MECERKPPNPACEPPKKPTCVDYVPKKMPCEIQAALAAQKPPQQQIQIPLNACDPCAKPPVDFKELCAKKQESFMGNLLKKLIPSMDCLYAVAFVAFPHLGGIPASVTIKNEITDWYENSITTPSWKPPNVLFAPIWTALYSTMGYASYLVWRDGGGFCYGRAKIPLLLYGTQLALNWAWPYIFFKSHNIGAALITAGALWFFTAATTYAFCPINQTAGYLMLPYLMWITYVGAINFSVWQENSS